MLEGQYRTADQGLPEFVSEVGSTVRSLNQDLFGSLVQPFAYGQDAFPFASLIGTGIRSHINRCTSNGPRAFSSAHTVADFTSGTSRSTVERLYRCGEVMRFRLQGDDGLYIFNDEIIGCRVVFRSELLYYRTFGKGYIVFVCRDNLVRILFGSLLNHLEQG